MEKEDFLNIIQGLDPVQLNELIEQKGKNRKLIEPIIRLQNKNNNNINNIN